MTESKTISSNFINRELSWLEFNNRVLEEAQDNLNPLFERLKFLAITCSNLDEFFMVRVASLIDQIEAGFDQKDFSGLTPKEQITKIRVKTHSSVEAVYNCFNRSLIPALKKENIYITDIEKLTKTDMIFINDYYNKYIFPVLTPMVVDSSRPFPLLLNKSLNIAMLISEKEKEEEESKKTEGKKEKGKKEENEVEETIFATIQIPSLLGRFLELPGDNSKRRYIFIEDIVKMNLENIFNGHNIITKACYRITRNADLSFDEEDAVDLLETIEQSLRKRKWGETIRLEVEKGIDPELLMLLEGELEIEQGSIYKIAGPLDLTFLMKFSSIKGFELLKSEPFISKIPVEFKTGESIFKTISEKDILLHHPYDSFDPVVNLVKEAAEDPSVLAIKQTLYRVSGKSPIVEALSKAAENGKQVTVLVELKARFDEENNILWAKRLEQAGCHVIYGLLGLKTHCKILLVVRREEDGIKRYIHLGTGNYNDVTANIYTDIGLFTTNPYIGADASALFNTLSGYSKLTNLYKFSVAPISLRSKFLSLIQRETQNSRAGKKAVIIAKLNSLVDQEIIENLYEASNAGVKIQLIVRGICCLRPDVEGLSKNISVTSIVGRFLEHSRIFYFYNCGNEEIYLSSADWMNRNLDKRVELLFPVEGEGNLVKLKNILNIFLKDTMKARILNKDGTYSRIDKRGKELLSCQNYFMNEAVEKSKLTNEEKLKNSGEFHPNTSFS